MTPKQFVAKIEAIMKKHGNTQNAVAMSKYMKNYFPFFGIKKPLRAELTMPLIKDVKEHANETWLIDTAVLLWKRKEREYHYIAIDLLMRYRKMLTPKSFKAIEELLVSNSWWDSVDGITGCVVSPLVSAYPELKTKMSAYISHPNMWLRRVSIIHQLPYRKNTDQGLLFEACLRNMNDQEFFIRKAIGWALRQYAKTEPKAVYSFVETHKQSLSGLSIREALKHK
jgi:3-methyladenine DNA glycosylase AlkD